MTTLHPTRFILRVVLPLGWLAAAAPRPADAQTLRELGRRLERATRPKKSQPGDSAAAHSAGESAGAAVRFLSPGKIEGSDSLGARFRRDSVTAIKPAAVPCGRQRACAPGWDLKVVSVAVPGRALPADADVSLTLEVENAGRAESPASEVRLCATRSASCEAPVGLVPVPPLQPGARLVVTRTVHTSPEAGEGWSYTAEVDPDSATGEGNRKNNLGATPPYSTAHPELQLLGVTVPPRAGQGRAGEVEMTLSLRNKSFVATSAPADVQMSGANLEGGCNLWGDSQRRIRIPALAPRQTYSARVGVRWAEGDPCYGNPSVMRVEVDPDNASRWGPAHERAAQSNPFTFPSGR